MKILLELTPHGISLLGLATLAVTLLSLIVSVRYQLLKLEWNLRLPAFLISNAMLVLAQAIADIATVIANGTEPSPLAAYFGSYSVSAFTFLVLIMLVCGLSLHTLAVSKRRSTLSSNAFKEAIDTLPDALCFSYPDGTPRLVNESMQKLAAELTGSILLNVNTFLEQLEERRFLPGNTVLHEDPLAVRTASGGVWEFRQNKKGEFTEILGLDISQEYELRQQLGRRKEGLSAMNARLKQYSLDVEEVARQREQLEARTMIHNYIGRFLMELRLHLSNPKLKTDQKELENLWEYTVSLLMNNTPTESDSEKDLEEMRQLAASMGLTLDMTGSLPCDKTNKDICIKAIFECIINTVRHAKGDRVEAAIFHTPGFLTVTLSNNGVTPEGGIQEGSGLTNLREAVEMAFGTMEITTDPVFRLTITLPE